MNYHLSLEIMIPMLILAGLASSIVASLIGVGGGFVAIPIIMLVIGNHNLEAKCIAYVSILALAIVAIFKYAKQGLSPDWKSALIISIGIIPAAVLCEHFVGPLLNKDEYKVYFHFIFGAVVLLVMFLIIYKDNINVPMIKTWQMPLAGAVVGALSGSLGFSGGILYMPLLTVWMKMDLKKAAVSTLSLKLITAGANIISALSSGHYASFEAHGVIWYAPLIIIIGSVIGSQIGPTISKKISKKAMMITFISVMSAIAFYELLSGILNVAAGIDLVGE